MIISAAKRIRLYESAHEFNLNAFRHEWSYFQYSRRTVDYRIYYIDEYIIKNLDELCFQCSCASMIFSDVAWDIYCDVTSGEWNYRNFFHWEISVFHCCHVIIKVNIHLMTQCGEIHVYLSAAGVTDKCQWMICLVSDTVFKLTLMKQVLKL
jgi:hypothetical protein